MTSLPFFTTAETLQIESFDWKKNWFSASVHENPLDTKVIDTKLHFASQFENRYIFQETESDLLCKFGTVPPPMEAVGQHEQIHPECFAFYKTFLMKLSCDSSGDIEEFPSTLAHKINSSDSFHSLRNLLTIQINLMNKLTWFSIIIIWIIYVKDGSIFSRIKRVWWTWRSMRFHEQGQYLMFLRIMRLKVPSSENEPSAGLEGIPLLKQTGYFRIRIIFDG